MTNNEAKLKDSNVHLYSCIYWIDDDLTDVRSRDGKMFGKESATFQEIDGEKMLVFVSNVPVQDDPHTAKLTKINDHGVHLILSASLIADLDITNFNIGASAYVTPEQLRKHDKSTPMRVLFHTGLRSGMMNSKLEIRFTKVRNDIMISGITVTIPYGVYKDVGVELSKMGVPDNINRFILD